MVTNHFLSGIILEVDPKVIKLLRDCCDSAVPSSHKSSLRAQVRTAKKKQVGYQAIVSSAATPTNLSSSTFAKNNEAVED